MRTRAIILKKQHAGEYDQQVTCFTEEFGKLTAVAKSILKPSSMQALHLDVINLVDFELVTGKALPIIAGAQVETTFPNIRSELIRLGMAYFFVETADKLFFDYQRDDGLWDFFISTFSGLNDLSVSPDHSDDLAGFFRQKQVEFLDVLGYAPNLEEYAPNSLNLIRTVLK